MLETLFSLGRQPGPKWEALPVRARTVPMLFVHHRRARRYLLRLRSDGTVRVTIPRHGSMAAGREFALRNVSWIEQQLQRLAAAPLRPATWQPGMEIWFRGERVRLERNAQGQVNFGTESLPANGEGADLRPTIEKHLRQLATQELPNRLRQLASAHGIQVEKISVRNQRSRWGSCSRRGNISLNWRLIQCPGFVSNYIMLHELAHRRVMNHSRRFWQEVERLCPDYRDAERWLRRNGKSLR